ncbi:MAG TPA: Bcr/CflA family multidrug efflux MFS transporter [Gammaproteobacteria bacterium]|nr:Bcr/CflA family multidrug efflux MFS transporter [Gammaproteobacteria bacterium]
MTSTQTRNAGLIALLGLLTAVGPLSIDTYLPSLPTIARELGASSAAVQQSVSAFFFGLAAGQIIYGPLSDRFGRRPALLLGFALYLVAGVVCALAGAIHVLIAARAVQGFGAAASASAGRAVIRDRWKGDEAARAMSFVVMVMAIAPLLAPVVGGQILEYFGWRAIFWMLTAFALLALALVTFRLPETNGPERRGDVRIAATYQAYWHLLADARVRAYLFCGGFVYAVMFAYIVSAPFVYIDIFGIDPQYFGFFFGLNVVGLIIGNYANGRLVVRLGHQRMLGIGAAITLLSSLALLGAALAGAAGIATVVVTLFFAVGPVGLVGANTVAGLLNLYPRNAGAASALFGVFQYGLGAAAGVAAGALYAGTPLAMGLVMALAAAGPFLRTCG